MEQSDLPTEILPLLQAPHGLTVLLFLKKQGTCGVARLAESCQLTQDEVTVVLHLAEKLAVVSGKRERLNSFGYETRVLYTCSLSEIVLRTLFAQRPAAEEPCVPVSRIKAVASQLRQFDYLLPDDYIPVTVPTRANWLGSEVPLVITQSTLEWAGELCLRRTLMDLESLIGDHSVPGGDHAVRAALQKVRDRIFPSLEQDPSLNLLGVLEDLRNPAYGLQDGGVCASTVERVVQSLEQLREALGEREHD